MLDCTAEAIDMAQHEAVKLRRELDPVEGGKAGVSRRVRAASSTHPTISHIFATWRVARLASRISIFNPA
jgi:hypothetical protein